jgi:hypothetical protein
MRNSAMHFAIFSLRDVVASLTTPDENSLVLIRVDYLRVIAHQVSLQGRNGLAGQQRV